MNNVERLQKLSGIMIVEGASYSSEKKYADHDKASLKAVKAELQGILANTARASFKYKNAEQELKTVNAALEKLDTPQDKKEDVKESVETPVDEVTLEEAADKKFPYKLNWTTSKGKKVSEWIENEKDLARVQALIDAGKKLNEAEELLEKMATSREELSVADLEKTIEMIKAKLAKVSHDADAKALGEKELADYQRILASKKEPVKEGEEKKELPAFMKKKKDDDKSEKDDDKDDEDEDEDEEDDKGDKSKKSEKKEEDEDKSKKEEKDEDESDEDDDDEECVCEEHMTADQKAEREKIVLGMKKNKSELKKKYGKDWKNVMYATATKMAMESVEESAESIAARIVEKDLTPQEIEVDYQNGPTYNSGIKMEQGTKIRVPSSVKAEVNKRIKEINKAILNYDDKGYNDKSVKQQAVECLEQIMQDLSTNDLEGVKKAQIYFETLMSPLTDFFPPKLINWLANALNPYVGVKESLIPKKYKRIAESDETAMREKWKSVVIPQGEKETKNSFANVVRDMSKQYPDAHLAELAALGYLEFFIDYIQFADDTPFMGVYLNPEEFKAYEHGNMAAKEDYEEDYSWKQRQESGYRSQEEIDDPMNDTEWDR